MYHVYLLDNPSNKFLERLNILLTLTRHATSGIFVRPPKKKKNRRNNNQTFNVLSFLNTERACVLFSGFEIRMEKFLICNEV